MRTNQNPYTTTTRTKTKKTTMNLLTTREIYDTADYQTLLEKMAKAHPEVKIKNKVFSTEEELKKANTGKSEGFKVYNL